MVDATKRTKVERLVATFERFAAAIASVDDAQARTLYKMASGVRTFVAKAREASPKPSPSAVAAGLEQALRETPSLISGIATEWRPQVANALSSALTAEYPEFLERDQERLVNVVSRGRIKSEAEFYLVRHQVDILEGVVDKKESLLNLYSLLGAYEAKT